MFLLLHCNRRHRCHLNLLFLAARAHPVFTSCLGMHCARPPPPDTRVATCVCVCAAFYWFASLLTSSLEFGTEGLFVASVRLAFVSQLIVDEFSVRPELLIIPACCVANQVCSVVISLILDSKMDTVSLCNPSVSTRKANPSLWIWGWQACLSRHYRTNIRL